MHWNDGDLKSCGCFIRSDTLTAAHIIAIMLSQADFSWKIFFSEMKLLSPKWDRNDEKRLNATFQSNFSKNNQVLVKIVSIF